MKTNILILLLLSLISNFVFAQTGSIKNQLESIPTSDEDEWNSPIGEANFLWACATTIKMPDFEERNNITFLKSLEGRGILVSTTAGDIWCLSTNDLSVIWKNKLQSEL